MKKLIVIGIALSALLEGLHAQETDMREKFTFGAKAGVNVSNVWDEQGEDFEADAKVGLAGGFFFGIPIGKAFGIQPEILISQKGFQGSGSLLGFPYTFKRTLTYLDIPILFQVKPVQYITIVAGPQFAYLLSQKNENSFGDYSQELEEEFDNNNIRKNMLGFIVGLDVNVSFVVASARVGWDFQYNDGEGNSTAPRYKNQWLQFTLGARI